MRFRSFVLGSLALLLAPVCLSLRVAPAEPDYGLSPGERFPRGEMKGFDASSDAEKSVVVVTWTPQDAISRATNARLSHQVQEGAQVLSICLDDDETEARLYAAADNVAEGTELLVPSQLGRRLRKRLIERGPRVYTITSGLVTDVQYPGVLWSELQTKPATLSFPPTGSAITE